MDLNDVKDSLAKQMSGMTRAEATAKGLCVACAQKIGPFRDDLSRREAQISGMCQECQDSVFGV